MADNIRIKTDEKLLGTVRSGILNRGASNVKIVATKIDVNVLHAQILAKLILVTSNIR